ncbi:MAG: sensor histidine kinase [Bacteroidia bacterium]|nr:sensor histidine kinase [Bacteroidia bacterium]
MLKSSFIKKFFLIIFLNLISAICLPQNNPLDSLKNILQKSKDDTSKVNTLIDICFYTLFSSPDKAFDYAQKALELSRKIGYKKGILMCYNKIGIIYWNQGNYELALKNYFKSLKICEELCRSFDFAEASAGKDGIADCYNNIGGVYHKQGNYTIAAGYFQKALKIFEELAQSPDTAKAISGKKGIATCYSNIGLVHWNHYNYSDAVEYFLKALKIFEGLSQSLVKSEAMAGKKGMASSYGNIGNVYHYQNNFKVALEYYQKSLKLYEELKDINCMSLCYNNIGNIHYYFGSLSWLQKDNKKARQDYQKALEYFEKALKIAEEFGDNNGISQVLGNIAVLNIQLYNYNEAVQFAEKSLNYAKKIGALPIEKDAYGTLATAYDSLRNYKKAYEFHKLYKQIDDSIFNEKNNKQIKEMEAKYQNEKKRKEIELLNEKTKKQDIIIRHEKEIKRIQLILLSGALCLLILLFLLIYSRHKHEQKVKMANALSEQHKLRFKEIIEAEEKERKRIAEDLHDSLGQILSTAKLNMSELEDVIVFKEQNDKAVFQNAIVLVNESCQEVRNISHNIMPGALIKLGLIPAVKELVSKINKSKKLVVEFNAQCFTQRLDESTEIALYRIIQEIMNNIIKHAEAEKVNIEILKNNNAVTLIINDNGKGFDISKIEKSSGIGWKNIFSRVSFLNGSINIDSKHNEGTTINIILCTG